MEYENLDLRISCDEAQSSYIAEVLSSPAGERSFSAFSLPFSRSQVADIKQAITRAILQGREIPQAGDLGKTLFEALSSPIQACYRSSRDQAEQQGKGLRVRLRLEPLELRTLPWEFLYDVERESFVHLSKNTPLIRYLPLPRPVKPLSVKPPLRILVIIANPKDNPVPGVEEELRQIHEAAAGFASQALISVETLGGKATLAKLRETLRQGDFHILHFIGHGKFDQERKKGYLVFENDAGNSRSVSGEVIGKRIGDEMATRLVVLNACRGAEVAETEAFTGVAAAMVKEGVPAVVAMQFPISGKAAVSFAGGFYGALAAGLGVEAAVGEGRKDVWEDFDGDTSEWGTPVLFTRVEDGRIFDLSGMEKEEDKMPSKGKTSKNSVKKPKRRPRPRVRKLTGWIAFVLESDRGSEIRAIGADGSEIQLLIDYAREDSFPSWAPDGQMVAFASRTARQEPEQIHIKNLNSGLVQQLTHQGKNSCPTWSPKGGSIAFVSNRDGTSQLWVMRVGKEGPGQLRRVSDEGGVAYPTWSPDGKKLAYASENRGILTKSLRAKHSRQLIEGEATYPAWSPKGDGIAYMKRVAGKWQIVVIRLASEKTKQLTSEGENREPTWSPDGRTVAFISNRDGEPQIWLMNADGGNQRPLEVEGKRVRGSMLSWGK